MLLRILRTRIETEFPHLDFQVTDDETLLSIPALNADVGGVDIQDDIDELTVSVGKFTHFHVVCYEEQLSEEGKAESIAAEITDFLKDLFNNKIILWGNEKGGGFYHENHKPNSKSWFGKQHKEWTWSGPSTS